MSAFDKIIGYDMVKGELRQLADCLKNTEKYREMGVSIPRGLLLEGEPRPLGRHRRGARKKALPDL